MHVAYASNATFVRIECRLFIIKYQRRAHIRVGQSATHYFIYSCSLCAVCRCDFIYTSFSFSYYTILINFQFRLLISQNEYFSFASFLFASARVRRIFQLMAFDCCKYLHPHHSYLENINFFHMHTWECNAKAMESTAYISFVSLQFGRFDLSCVCAPSSLW